MGSEVLATGALLPAPLEQSLEEPDDGVDENDHEHELQDEINGMKPKWHDQKIAVSTRVRPMVLGQCATHFTAL